MQVLKCKSCGANLTAVKTGVLVQCDHCGVTQTIPRLDSEKKLTAFARANKLRIVGDFDKAAGVYESIVAEFPEEAEAYWCLVLCKYGVEYVDDPATGKKVPTCHRSSYDSVLDDDNFEQAMENSGPEARAQYREEAKFLETLRRQIVEVSAKEEPYDIFISYKETDFNGERTLDSVLAQDIYQMLTKKGYRVFFSRISLKDHLGKQYEPYIFAALNSAKIMLVVGTDYEYFNAPWVKNEWSRYLQLIAKGDQKTLIPCYKNIDIDDMPREFGSLQAQNLSVVGYMQDLESGIEKILPLESKTQAGMGAQAKSVATTDSYLTRAYMYLADGEFAKADEYAEKVLDIEPTNGKAHMCKLMVEFRVTREEALGNVGTRLDLSKNYEKVLQFGDDAMRERVLAYEEAVYKRIGKRNAMLQEAEQKKQAVLAEVKRSKELVGKAEQKCNTIQAAINQKGQYLEKLKQTVESLTNKHRSLAYEAKARYIPLWIILPVAAVALVLMCAAMLGYAANLLNGYVACLILFVMMVVGAALYATSHKRQFGSLSVPLFIVIAGCFVFFFIGLWVEHGGPLNFLGALLHNSFMFWEDNDPVWTFTVWSVTWIFSSLLCYLAGILVACIGMFKRFSLKRNVKLVAKELAAKTAEYDEKVRNDVELRRLHEELKNAKAEYSSTLGSCRNAIHQMYNEYHRMMNTCNIKAEALIPKEFE